MSAETKVQAAKAARFYLRGELRFVVALWVFLVVCVVLFTGFAHYFAINGIDSSIWEQATQAPRWFLGTWGIYQSAVYLPIFIAHGYTRREFAREVAFVAAVYAIVVAALTTLGFALEWLAYRAFGWPQTLDNTYLLFSAPTQYPLILVHYTLAFFIWITIGAAVGAAFYRFRQWAMLTVPVALFALVFIETALTWSRLLLPDPAFPLSVGNGLAVYITVLLIGLSIVWMLTRDMPMRTKHN